MMQKPIFKPQTEWLPPTEFPDLSNRDEIAIDLETKDPDLMKMGSGSIVKNGEVVGIAVAAFGVGQVTLYLKHPEYFEYTPQGYESPSEQLTPDNVV